MLGKNFYDIPVYRLPEQKYFTGMTNFINHQLLVIEEQEIEYQIEETERKMRVQEHLRKKYGGAWQFNEIVGYVRLYFSGNQILGEYWQTDTKRKVRSRRKLFVLSTYKIAPELDLPFNGTSKEIYEIILEYLNDVQNELKGRVLDTSTFKTVGPFVNWRGIVERL